MQALAQHTSFNAETRERSLTSIGMRDIMRIEDLRVSAFEIPTDAPESDGTY